MVRNIVRNLTRLIFGLMIFVVWQLGMGSVSFSEANERILFYDDFSDGIINWNQEGHILPEVVDDGTGNKVARFRHSGMRGGDVNWTDCQAEIKFRLLPGTGNDFYRLVFNVRCDEANPSGMYSARFQYSGGDMYFQVWKGTQNVVSKKYSSITPLEKFGTDWHTLAMRVVGNTLSGYLDGEELFIKSLPDIPPKGNIFIDWYIGVRLRKTIFDFFSGI